MPSAVNALLKACYESVNVQLLLRLVIRDLQRAADGIRGGEQRTGVTDTPRWTTPMLGVPTRPQPERSEFIATGSCTTTARPMTAFVS